MVQKVQLMLYGRTSTSFSREQNSKITFLKADSRHDVFSIADLLAYFHVFCLAKVGVKCPNKN